MGYGKRIRVLLLGFCASGMVVYLLVRLCTTASSVPCRQDETISFPCVMETLVVHQLTGFEGGYIEDGSLEEVSNVAALVLENTSDRFLNAKIQVHTCADTLEFSVYMIAPHSRLMVLEANKRQWELSDVLSVESQVIPLTIEPLALELTPEGQGTLRLKNTTDCVLRNITVYHKTCYENLYVGGIVYSTEISSLLPGETVYLHPQNYANNASRVILIAKTAPS